MKKMKEGSYVGMWREKGGGGKRRVRVVVGRYVEYVKG